MARQAKSSAHFFLTPTLIRLLSLGSALSQAVLVWYVLKTFYWSPLMHLLGIGLLSTSALVVANGLLLIAGLIVFLGCGYLFHESLITRWKLHNYVKAFFQSLPYSVRKALGLLVSIGTPCAKEAAGWAGIFTLCLFAQLPFFASILLTTFVVASAWLCIYALQGRLFYRLMLNKEKETPEPLRSPAKIVLLRFVAFGNALESASIWFPLVTFYIFGGHLAAVLALVGLSITPGVGHALCLVLALSKLLGSARMYQKDLFEWFGVRTNYLLWILEQLPEVWVRALGNFVVICNPLANTFGIIASILVFCTQFMMFPLPVTILLTL